MKNVKVAILGFGTVGLGVFHIISKDSVIIREKEGINLTVSNILVRSMDSKHVRHAKQVCTTSYEEILKSDADIIVECIGGDTSSFILQALKHKKHVVTSNKEVVAKHWKEFEKAVRESGTGIYMEAAVGGGIPIIKTMTDSMQANKIQEVMGIINGTTNYVLTKMTDRGLDFSEVLKEAQQLGYAEADPKNDVEGYDNMYKLSILGSLAFNAVVPIEKIYREGITKVSFKDIELAKEFGYVVKMLAIGKRRGSSIEVRVHPTMIPKAHPLASVGGVFNAVFLKGNNVDDIMLYGRGAGELPTASAVVSDVLYAAKGAGSPIDSCRSEDDGDIKFISDFKTAAFINLTVQDKLGVLSEITAVLAKNGVSVSCMVQKKKSKREHVRLIFITHEAYEQQIKHAIEQILGLEAVVRLNNMIRVENG